MELSDLVNLCQATRFKEFYQKNAYGNQIQWLIN